MDVGFQVERCAFGPEAVSCAGIALVWIERGELRAYLAPGEPIRLAPGDGLVLGAGQIARMSARQPGAHGIVFRAEGGWLARAFALAGLEPASSPLRAATLRAGTRAARRASLCLRALTASEGEPAAETLLSRTARALELLEAAREAGSDALGDVPRQRQSPARAALARELDALSREPAPGLTLSRLARRLGLSERQASRLVHERLGISLGDHLAGLRIARAKRLLWESDRTVIDVAAEAGFGSLGHFNHVFRSHVGCTPSAFRRLLRRDPEATGAGPDQPPEAGGEEIASDPECSRASRVSLRSSRFTIASSQAERGRLPS